MRILFVLLFAIVNFYGFELNQTIVDANRSFYEHLLAKLSKIDRKSDEIALQQALLQKIIHLPTTPRPSKLSLPSRITTQEAFQNLLKKYIDTTLTLEQLRKRMKQNEEFMENIEQRVARSSDANSTLTLQLQYALYKKINDSLKTRIEQLQNQQKAIEQLLQRSLPNVRFDPKKLRQKSEKLVQKLQKLEKKAESLELDKERYEILGKKREIERIEKKIESIQEQKRQMLQSLLIDKTTLFFAQLQSKDQTLFSTQKDVIKLAKRIDPSLTIALGSLMQNSEKRYLGTAMALKGWTLFNVKITLQKFWRQINEPLFTLGKTPISGFKIAMALIAVIFGFIIGSLYKRSIQRLSSSISESTKTILSNLGYYFFVLLGLFLSLNILGVNLSSLTIIAGALSVGIGFGLQNIVSNFVSGLILMFERSVKIGDYIEIDENLRGHVSDIRMRSTTITTNSNIDIIIPNQEFIQNRVINWTMNDKIRRFEIPFGVAYGSDIDRVRSVILEAVKKSGFKDIYERPPSRMTRVIMTGMGESSVDFELFVWIRGKEILYPKRTVSRFLELIYKTLYEEGIEIPFPQRDIHIRSVDKEIPLRISHESKS